MEGRIFRKSARNTDMSEMKTVTKRSRQAGMKIRTFCVICEHDPTNVASSEARHGVSVARGMCGLQHGDGISIRRSNSRRPL
jgi:hypothetical protein